MFLRTIRWISLVVTAVTLSALAAHTLELPNKMALDGSLWLAVHQNLYRGWGPFIGPFEVAAVAATWMLAYLRRQDRTTIKLTLPAAILLSGALCVFFALNAPVNAAFASWPPATLPPDWPNYRTRWELGHAISFVLVLMSFVALLRAVHHDALLQALRRSRDRQGSPASASRRRG